MFKSKWAVLAAALLQTIAWIAILHSDPFGMSSAADRASEQIFLRLYPIMYPPYWRDHIKVVMIENLPLTEKGSPEWPLTLDEHIALIERVIALRPRGIFVDILFDTGESNKRMYEYLVGTARQEGVPIVFASFADPEKKLVSPLQTLPFSEKASRPKVLRGFVELAALPNHYQMVDQRGAMSAAVAMYNATVDDLNRASTERYHAIDADTPSDMLLAWGNTVPTMHVSDVPCAPIIDDFQQRWNALANVITLGALRLADLGGGEAMPGESTWDTQQPCSYHGKIAARKILNKTDMSAEHLDDAYVLIGTKIAGLGDTVDSPVHGQLPGVFLHAMALDNLLTMHGRPLMTSGWAGLPQALLVFTLTLIGSMWFAGRTPPTTRLEAAYALATSVIAWAFFGLLAVGFLLAFLTWLSLPPYNWGSVLAIAGVTFFAGTPKALYVLLRGGTH